MYDEMELNNVTETTELAEATEACSGVGKGMLYGMGIAGAIYGIGKLVKWGIKTYKAKKQDEETEEVHEVKDAEVEVVK